MGSGLPRVSGSVGRGGAVGSRAVGVSIRSFGVVVTAASREWLFGGASFTDFFFSGKGSAFWLRQRFDSRPQHVSDQSFKFIQIDLGSFTGWTSWTGGTWSTIWTWLTISASGTWLTSGTAFTSFTGWTLWTGWA